MQCTYPKATIALRVNIGKANMMVHLTKFVALLGDMQIHVLDIVSTSLMYRFPKRYF